MRASQTVDTGWRLQTWLAGQSDVAAAVAGSLLSGESVSPTDELTFARQLPCTKEAVLARLQQGDALDKLAACVAAGLSQLKAQRAATGAELSSKFTAEGEAAFELQYAKTGSFFRGLDGIIGPATMYGEPRSVYNQLEREHCSSPDSDIPFKTP